MEEQAKPTEAAAASPPSVQAAAAQENRDSSQVSTGSIPSHPAPAKEELTPGSLVFFGSVAAFLAFFFPAITMPPVFGGSSTPRFLSEYKDCNSVLWFPTWIASICAFVAVVSAGRKGRGPSALGGCITGLFGLVSLLASGWLVFMAGFFLYFHSRRKEFAAQNRDWWDVFGLGPEFAGLIELGYAYPLLLGGGLAIIFGVLGAWGSAAQPTVEQARNPVAAAPRVEQKSGDPRPQPPGCRDLAMLIFAALVITLILGAGLGFVMMLIAS